MSKDDVEDFLTEDPEISSQKVVLLSFLSPEKILANKDQFFFRQFLQDYDVQWRTSKLEAWMANQLVGINERLEKIAGNLDRLDLSGAAQEVRSNLLRVDRFVEDFQEYKRKANKEISQSAMAQEFDDFVFRNGAKLEEDFFAKNEFRTTIRGIKVRGVFASEAEAAARAKRLQKADPNFNILMGAVGKWMAWDPDPTRVPNHEYANDQLNTLMKKYRENEEGRDQYYQEQKERRLAQANVRKGESSGTGAAFAESGGDAGVSSYGGMFGESGDLAIRRKMEGKREPDS